MPGVGQKSALVERERALRFLKSSKLTIYDEYKSMVRDIQMHFDETKRASYSGNKKRENDMRPFLYDTGDTYEQPFFSVLTKMLLEINSMSSHQKQLEDLQRVYQWYITNKKQLCRVDKHFSTTEEISNSIKYRPSSSINPGVKTGILRHDKEGTKESPRHARPQTSSPHSKNGKILQDAILTVGGINGISPPDIPDDLKEYQGEPTSTSRREHKRPDTAPPYVMLDRNSNQIEKKSAAMKKEQSKADGSGAVPRMQSPVSKVSIHYNAQEIKEGENDDYLPLEQITSISSSERRDQLQRSKSADYFSKSVRFKSNASDSQSEIDEDRVILDADQVVRDASSDDLDLDGAIIETVEVQGDFNNQSFEVHEDTQTWEPDLETMVRDNDMKDTRRKAAKKAANHNQHETRRAGDQPKIEYIPSYAKFQKLRERKQISQEEDEKKRNFKMEKGIQPAKSTQQSIARKQVDRHSGLTKNGLSTNALLELVTPVGQQMLEQKVPIHISQEFHRDVRSSPSNSPLSSPRERLSPRLFLRPTGAIKGDQNGHTLKKAEIMLPEESSKQYKVHFPQERQTKTEKHYKVSGPVEPDTVRYQYTRDGFGNRTYIKKLSRPYNGGGRLDKSKAKTKATTPDTLLHNKDPRFMNTKALASSMIIKHLGASGRRSDERMTGQSSAIPMWIASQDAENQSPEERYMKLTKSLEKESSYSSGSSENSRPRYHVKQIDVDLPTNSQPLYIFGDDRARDGDSELARLTKTYPPQHRHSAESHDSNYQDHSKLDWLNQYNGGFYPLKAEGHAVQVGPKSKQAINTKSPSNNSNSTSTQLQTPASPGSHRPGRSNSREASHHNLSRPNSACSKASSRVSSARSRQSTQKHLKKGNDETVEGFDVKKFSHYCFDDNPLLEEDFVIQKLTNAAVDIQRIFRGHMARNYARELREREKERQRKAAVTLQRSMRGFLTRRHLMEERLAQRPPQVDSGEWEKTYKEQLKKKDNERQEKVHARSKQFAKLQAQQDEKINKVNASKTIYDLFHDKGPSKAQMKAAAITIQRYVRGWLVRKYFQKAKQKAMKRTLDFGGFLKSYKLHLERIMERHGVKDPKAILAFNELLEYIEKRTKYEIEYDRIAKGKPQDQIGVFTYEDIKKFFEACGQYPSRKEIDDAIKLAVEEVVEMKEHSYTKAQIVEIAFQIYVPKGTKLKDTRKSTWMNPLVDGDEAAMMKLSKKINEDTSLHKVMEFVSATKLGQLEMEDRAITPTLLPEDAKRNGFELLKDRPVRKISQAKKKR